MLRTSVNHALLLKVVFINNLPIWCLHVTHQSSAFLSNRRERYSCWHSRPRPWRRRVLDPLLCAEQSPKCVARKSYLTEIIRKNILYVQLALKRMVTSLINCSRYLPKLRKIYLALLTIKGYSMISPFQFKLISKQVLPIVMWLVS